MVTGITRLRNLLVLLLLLSACASFDLPLARRGSSGLEAAAPSATLPPPSAPTVQPTAAPTPDPDVRLFPETGHTLRGPFRRFWERNGGLPAFGLPLTEALPIDTVTTQYFERARFELRGGEVTLGRLGADLRREARAPIMPAAPQSGCRYFAETRHNLCPPLLDFWQQAGGLPLLGYPIEEAKQQGTLRVQYFERARFEVPEGKPAQLGRVGAEALDSAPGGVLLRVSSTRPSQARALIVGQTRAAEPLAEATIHVKIERYSGPAEVVVADRRQVTGRYPVRLKDGQAEVKVAALGTLGPQAAIVLLDGQVAAVHTGALVLRAETQIRANRERLDALVPLVKGFMDQDTSDYVFDGHHVHGYRSPDSDLLWLRDHVHQGKGYAYWERDMTSLLDQFRRFQHPEGYFDDYIANKPWGLIRGRTAVEADLEYLFIEGVFRAWQATGDDDWLREQVDAMERGLRYVRSDPLRWDAERQLVKRPFTVDTWDFEYGPPTISPEGKPSPRHWIDQDTKWSIFHGDNTGYANSMELLARMYDHLGNGERAAHWRREATGIMQRLSAMSWNGTFFRHMVHLTPVAVPGVDESKQLSLSNAYAVNRAGVSREQARSIIGEYQRRNAARGPILAEWYSIDPPFPAGSLSTGPGWGKEVGEYVNGGIMPLVGGELARGAFQHGEEFYGFDILERYYDLVKRDGGSYLWYHPDGRPGISGPDTLATDGWGSSAMLAALIEGAAGVRDDAKLFERATLAPRWEATGDIGRASTIVRYGASNGYVAYRWARRDAGIDMRWTGSGSTVQLRILLPKDTPMTMRVTIDGQPTTGAIETVGASRYWVAKASATGSLSIRW